MTAWMTGEEACATYGVTTAQVDHAAATGVIPAEYQSWQLMVAPPPSGLPVDEVQRFDIAGSPGSGRFTLSFNGSEPTTPLGYHPAEGDVQRALEALSTIGTGNVVVTKSGNWGYVCSFGGALGHADLPQMEADGSQLRSGATITVTTVRQGSSGTKKTKRARK